MRPHKMDDHTVWLKAHFSAYKKRFVYQPPATPSQCKLEQPNMKKSSMMEDLICAEGWSFYLHFQSFIDLEQ